MPYVKFRGHDEVTVPDLRLASVKPNQTIEVTDEQLPGLICQEIWEEAKATKAAAGVAEDLARAQWEVQHATKLADDTVADAKAKGLKAVQLSEGAGQPDSIFVFDKKAIIGMPIDPRRRF